MDLLLDYHFFYGLLVGIAVTLLWPDFQVPKKMEKTDPTDFDWTRLLTDVRSGHYKTRNNARRAINKISESYMAFRLAYNDILNEEATQTKHYVE
jgi:hypothetical protein